MVKLQSEKWTLKPAVLWKYLVLLLVAGTLVCQPKASAGMPQNPPTVQAFYLSPEEVASKSVAVVHVNIVAVSPVMVGNRVYTDVEGRVRRVWKGAVEGDRIVIRQLGGRMGQVVTVAGPNPAFVEAQDWILGLAKPSQGWWTVYGLKHGAFQLLGDTAVRDYSGFSFIGQTPATVSNNRERIPITELHKILASYSDKPKGGESPVTPPIKKASSGIDSKRFSRDSGEMDKRKDDSSGGRHNAGSPGSEAWDRSTLLLIALVTVLVLLGFVIWRLLRGRRRK
ncbi:hypothetical protein N9174_00565 [bacterium]|nr:hypothetical protein [bacterium]